MPDRIRFGNDSVVFSEETFGELDTAELAVNRDELGEYKLHLDVEGAVSIGEFVGWLESGEVELDLTHFRTSTIEIHEEGGETEDDEVEELTRSLAGTKRKNMPSIPGDDGLKTETDYAHYRRLVENPDSQPAKYLLLGSLRSPARAVSSSKGLVRESRDEGAGERGGF